MVTNQPRYEENDTFKFDSEKRKRTQKQIGLMGSTTKEKVMIFNYFFSK
jgi:hypothetical protein